MRRWIKFWIGFASAVLAFGAGPVDFGASELDAAIASHGFRYKPKIDSEINLDPPETFRIDPYSAGGGRISGGDLRGLMYGFLEAAEQIRTLGHLKLIHAIPAASPRGVWLTADPGASWFSSEEFWRRTFETLARDRFDRVQLVFDHMPSSAYFAVLRTISQVGARYAVDVVLGFRLLQADFAPALQDLLAKCPSIHVVALNPGISETEQPAEALREPVQSVLAKAGRRVVLETPGSLARLNAAQTQADLETIRSAIVMTGFEIAAPSDERGEPTLKGIGLWGRLGYDPKPEPATRPASKALAAKPRALPSAP